MKILLQIALLVFLWGCGPSDSIAGGGDDFPSMISTCGEQIARVINGELSIQNTTPVEADFGVASGIRARSWSISGDTLWFDSSRIENGTSITDRCAFSITDTSVIYLFDRRITNADGVEMVTFRDYDGDGFLYRSLTKPFSLKITSSGAQFSSWWYKGETRKDLTVQRFFIKNEQGTAAWFRPQGDSLAVANDSVRLIVTRFPDEISLDCIAQGSAENIDDDLVTSVAFRSFRQNSSIDLKLTPSVASPYRSILKNGTFSSTIIREDSTQQFTGMYSENIIAIIPESGDTVWFNRSGKIQQGSSK